MINTLIKMLAYFGRNGVKEFYRGIKGDKTAECRAVQHIMVSCSFYETTAATCKTFDLSKQSESFTFGL